MSIVYIWIVYIWIIVVNFILSNSKSGSDVKSKKNRKKCKNKDRFDCIGKNKSNKKDRKFNKREGSNTNGGKLDPEGRTKDVDDDDGTDSEEERWLDAIESGKLEEVIFTF